MERQGEGGGEARADVEDTRSSRSSGSSAHLRLPQWTQLVPLRTKEDTQTFLRCIYTKFLDIADENHNLLPFMDHLIQLEVLNDSDTQSLSGCHYPTPREKARRLWHILFTTDHRTFITKVLPPLCQHYWYIIPERCWLPGNASWVTETSGSWMEAEHPVCTRCSIKGRIRPVDVVDILVELHLITPEEHLDVIQGYRMRSTNWSKIFDAFKKLAGCDVSSHVARMQKLIDEHSLPVPDNLPELLTTGFPCTCHSHRPQSEYCLSMLASGTATSSEESSLPSLRFSWPSLQTSTNSLSPPPSTPSHSRSSDIHRQNDDEETALKKVVSVGTLTRPWTTEEDSSDGASGRRATQVGGEHTALKQAGAVHGLTAQGESASPPEVEEKIAESCFEESVYYQTDETSLSELTVTKTSRRKSSLMSPTQKTKQRACTGSLKKEQLDFPEGSPGHYTLQTKSEVAELHDSSLLEPLLPEGNREPGTSDPMGDATESSACVVILSPAEQQNERQNTQGVDDHPAQSDNDSDASVTNVKTRVFAWSADLAFTFGLKICSASEKPALRLMITPASVLPYLLFSLCVILKSKWLLLTSAGFCWIHGLLIVWLFSSILCIKLSDLNRCDPRITCQRTLLIHAGYSFLFYHLTVMLWHITFSPYVLIRVF